MSNSNLYIGDSMLQNPSGTPGWDLVVNGEEEHFFRISGQNKMAPFLMSIVSNSDHWMFISSTGGVTAGRKNPDFAIFPYSTDDKVHESHYHTGSFTIVRLKKEAKVLLWEPFSASCAPIWEIERSLYKNSAGNKIIFEEINHSLGLCFRYAWMNSEKYGWIRKCSLENRSEIKAELSILDGLRNVLPYGVTKNTQEQMSTLMDAYKRTELDRESGIGIFGMSSIPVDRAEPSEALKATTVWCTAPDIKAFLLSDKQVQDFIFKGEVETEYEKNGIRSSYLVVRDLSLAPGRKNRWYFAADVAQDHSAMEQQRDELLNSSDIEKQIETDVEEGTINLKAIAARADGIQQCQDPLISARHFSNVLFNVMRGGIFAHDYLVETADYFKYLSRFNPALYEKKKKLFSPWPAFLTYSELNKKVQDDGDVNLIRLSLEYLPLTFSRRHGDPSRPWNRFSINVKNEDGSLSMDYQGNWRDIFQNWEALALSYPGYLPGMIARFLNATTADGYNPYRITRDGIDWEVFDPEDPWSFIGYWGDHQVIYLLRLLELSENYLPGQLQQWLNKDWFAYANVPYRIKAYEDLVKDPVNTILFDQELHNALNNATQEQGADARLIKDKNGSTVHASLTEKLLVTILTKLSNFIPGGGIWLNTQRPEWNDANNALVGYGVSMVTTYYLNRFLPFLKQLFEKDHSASYALSPQLIEFLREISTAYNAFAPAEAAASPKLRKELTDRLGMAGSHYRQSVYKGHFAKKAQLNRKEIIEVLDAASAHIRETIRVSAREDGLYEAYNLIELGKDEIQILHLQEMLEGQVALLSSGYLSTGEAINLLKKLRESELYREDQNSYMLYPAKKLKGMLEKNQLSPAIAAESAGVSKILSLEGQKILLKDLKGNLHFNGDFRNASYLLKELEKIKTLDRKDKEELLSLYENLFHHRFFTGRSGSFFKYEGLGSIYWHMVAKLVLAVAEITERAADEACSEETMSELQKLFHEIKEGIGLHKKPEVYGAFPTDPYSHTPAMYGAQQPGMTGQVKEDIISRMKELGVRVEKGEMRFDPVLLEKDEFIHPNSGGNPFLAFSVCGIPVEYRLSDRSLLKVIKGNGEEIELVEPVIPGDLSREIFNRNGAVQKILYYLHTH